MPRRILSLFRNLFRKRDIEQALDDELRSTLEALTQEKIEQGLSQAVARREALIEIGGIEQVKERVRVARVGHFVEVLVSDVRYGLRQLRRNRSFTAVEPLWRWHFLTSPSDQPTRPRVLLGERGPSLWTKSFL